MWVCVLDTFTKLRQSTVSFGMSVFPSVRPSAWNNPALTGRTFMKFDISVFFETLTGKFKFH